MCLSFSLEYTDVPWLETVTVHNEEKNELTIFAVNRNLTESLDLEAKIYGFEKYRLAEHTALYNADLKAVNSAQGEKVKPVTRAGGTFNAASGLLEASLPPASWNVLRLSR